MRNVALPEFLHLPPRARKPRSRGLTHLLDKGLSVAQTEDLLRSAGDFIDVWKWGWGTAYLDRQTPAKLALLQADNIRACLGGTLLEIAWSQAAHKECLAWAADVGFESVEVSRGTVAMTVAEKAELIELAAQQFVVFAETGSKDPTVAVDSQQWCREAVHDLAAGATFVVAEGRESGTVGLYRPDGSVRADLVAQLVEAAGVDRVLFETPRKDQQAWLIRQLGPDVNLANIPASEVMGVEALRLGLRADTAFADSLKAPTQ